MKVIAFNFTSSEIYYVVLSGNKVSPIFDSKNKISLPVNYTIPRRVEWFETELTHILNTVHPDKVAYRLTINNVTNQYVSNVYYGQAILNLLCNKKSIAIESTSPASIVPSKFNQPKNTDLYNYITIVLGNHPPHWDKKMKDASLMALNSLT